MTKGENEFLRLSGAFAWVDRSVRLAPITCVRGLVWISVRSETWFFVSLRHVVLSFVKTCLCFVVISYASYLLTFMSYLLLV